MFIRSILWTIILTDFVKFRYEESEKSYKKFLDIKPGNSAVEKELSQLYQSRDALDTALNLFDSGNFTKSLGYVDKVVLVFSPECSKVTIKIIAFIYL